MSKVLYWVLALALPLAAEPTVFNDGVLNAASFMSSSLPAGSIARGSLFTIFGIRMGPTTLAQATSFPLQTTLAGVSIKITQATASPGATSVDGLPAIVTAGQITAIMPSNAPLGAAFIRVTYLGVQSQPVRI